MEDRVIILQFEGCNFKLHDRAKCIAGQAPRKGMLLSFPKYMTVESLTPLIRKPRSEFTPIPAFPRKRGKALNTPPCA